MIGELFRIEREELVDKTPKERKLIRQAKSKPVVDAFFRWRDEQSNYALDDTPLAKALGYAFNQRDALERFLDDGRLPLHNNWSELELRREAIGRKNWLFLGSEGGGKVNATFMTLIASCHMHGLEPWAYLRDLLCVLPSWPHSRILELAPAYWRETSQKQEAQWRRLPPGHEWRRLPPGHARGRRGASTLGIAGTRTRVTTRLAGRIQKYFAGLEPASDEETRLFTTSSRGPLHLRTRTS